MADALVSVGRHFVTPDYIAKLAATITPTDVGQHGIAVKFGIDNDAAKVAFVFTPKGDAFALRTAYRYDWDAGHQFGIDGSVKW